MATIRIFIVIAGTMFLCLSPNKAQQVKHIPISVITSSQSDSESVTCPADDVKAVALSQLQMEVSALLTNLINPTQQRDCCQVQLTSNIYYILDVCSANPSNVTSFVSGQPLQARCDMDTDEGGWLVILRRKSNASPLVNFNRTWTEYENGFGDLNTEFWYGLRNIHCLTQRDDLELRIDVRREDGLDISWTYQQFEVAGADDNYRLTIGPGVRVAGTGSNQMTYNNGRQFSTYDRDNSQGLYGCGHSQGSGWWYENCSYVYFTNPHSGVAGGQYRLTWDNGANYYSDVEMKVRPKTCLQ